MVKIRDIELVGKLNKLLEEATKMYDHVHPHRPPYNCELRFTLVATWVPTNNSDLDRETSKSTEIQEKFAMVAIEEHIALLKKNLQTLGVEL